MSANHLWQRHQRPAVASRQRTLPGEQPETEYLCDLCLAEDRMRAGFGGRSFFDDFFSGSPAAAGRAVETPPRRAERIDVTQFFSDATRELLQRAAQTSVVADDRLDLQVEHGAPEEVKEEAGATHSA
jgi:ATP-dependent Clp protease ATP-binding subunit ClpC